MENYIEKATFSEIYKFLNGNGKKDLLKCFTGLFKIGLVFLPRLLCPEAALITDIGNGVNLLGAAETIEAGVGGIYNYFKGKHYTDYRTRYDEMQIAHYMITYAAFFDTIKECLPDENGIIKLKDNEKLIITQEAVSEYIKSLEKSDDTSVRPWIDEEVLLPNPLCSFYSYADKLVKFYSYYNNEFIQFFKKLKCWESMSEETRDRVNAVIRDIPSKAVENYKKQYYELSKCFEDFALWSNQREMYAMEGSIDIGFKNISKAISELKEQSNNDLVRKVLDKQHNLYCERISESIVSGIKNTGSENQMSFPAKKDIFVPQQFKAIRYSDNIKLESKKVWKNAKAKDDIGAYINGLLHHPDFDTKPLIILGHPGAGKTLLCNMLAAKLFHNEYHVIIVNLRNAHADDTIVQQITDQLKDEVDDRCSWYNILEAKLDKPLLIIFDGYDELLQSSGKTYSNYINTIAEFQKNQLIASNQLVRCVITSRITLIDKAYIPEGAAVLRLCDFNEKRIDTWIDIWNSYNKEYFNENNLNEFYLPKDEKISDLAHQPLLLMMLALYDSTDNNLAKQKNLTQTQLYDNLIRDFIKREKNKDEEFKNKQISAQNKELSEEMIRIGIAAIGMYNRGIYHITSKDLNLDINFYSGTCQLISSKYSLEDGLTEAEALLGSFFFMHKSLSIERDNGKKIENTAYEFLHNTFGEFLTSDFILLNIYNAVEEISFRMNNNRTICWNDIFVDSWYASLVYTPLFSKPVVVKMLKERSCELFKNKQIDKENVISAADLIVNRELERIMEGDIFNSINKLIGIRENVYPKQSLLVHIAIYSINLLIIRNVLTNESASIELLDSLGKDTLDKLIEIWKYAFDDNDLLSLSHLFSLHKEENNKQNYIVVSYTPNENGFKNNDNRLPNLYDISYSIDDRVIKSFTGCLIADIRHKEEVLAAMESCHLDIKSNYLLMSIINCIFRQEDSIDLKCLLNEFLETSIKENNYAFLYVYCLLLEYF